MTTESKQDTTSGGSVLLGAAFSSVVVGFLAVLVAALSGGTPAAYGALTGALLVLTVFSFGSFTVNAVSTLMPAASLLVALLTYTLQVAAMGMALLVLNHSGLLEDALDRRWLAGAVIVGTFGWLVAQIALATRARIPAYDLGVDVPEAGTR
jgi:hypothetical protein